jgi:hypothetical protein
MEKHSTWQKVNNLLTLDVVNAQGEQLYPAIEMELGDKRRALRIDIRNTAWSLFYPDEPKPIAVDWRRDDGNMPESTFEVMRPISYDGKVYRGDWAWGSGIKEGRTYGMVNDIPRESGIFHFGEDGVRVGRWLFANAYPGAMVGTLKIRIVARGTRIGNHEIHDGHGVVSRRLAEFSRNPLQAKTQLGKVSDSFQVSQRLPASPGVWAEVERLVQARLDRIQNDHEWVKLVLEDDPAKKRWAMLDHEMLAHPFVTKSVVQNTKKLAISVATSVPMDEDYRVVIPGDAISEVGHVHLGRYPMQALNNNRAFDTTNDARSAELHEWVKGVEVVQYSLTNPAVFAAKGTLALCDEDMGDADIILCEDDVKLAMDKNDFVAHEWHEVEDCYFGITAWWAKGSAITVPYDTWSHMGGDYDGDGAVVGHLEDKPEIFKAFQNLGEQPAVKLPKTKTKLTDDGRAKVMIRSFESAVLVGMATNVLSTILADEKPERKAIEYMFKSLQEALEVLNYLIQVGTDGFKTACDTAEAKRICMDLVQNGVVSWCKWKRDKLAFTKIVPHVSDRGGMHVNPSLNGTVARIAKMALPVLEKVFEGFDLKPNEPGYYREWAIRPEEWLLEDAKYLNGEFGRVARSIDWTQGGAAEQLKAWLDAKIAAWKEKRKITDDWTLANACWYAAHSSKAASMPVALPFWAFTEQVVDIITEKPGLKFNDKPAIVVLGIERHYDNPPSHYRGPITIKRHVSMDGKSIRGYLCLDFPMDHTNDKLPEGASGVISKESWIPDEREYHLATLTRHGSQWLLSIES